MKRGFPEFKDVFLFVQTVDIGLSKVSKVQNISQGKLIKLLMQFNHEIKRPLFSEIVDGELVLTTFGEDFLQNQRQNINDYISLVHNLTDLEQQQQVIRLFIPPGLFETIMPLLHSFRKSYPNVNFIIDINHRLSLENIYYYDLVFSQAESALVRSDSMLIDKVIKLNRLLCAHPDYLQQRPPIRVPNDLKLPEHQFIDNPVDNHCLILRDSVNKEYPIRFNSMLSVNSVEAYNYYVCHAQGIGALSPSFSKALIEQYQLVSILPQYQVEPVSYYIMLPYSDYVPIYVTEFKKLFYQYIAAFN